MAEGELEQRLIHPPTNKPRVQTMRQEHTQYRPRKGRVNPVQAANKMLGTVGASSSVTRRVLSENVDVIYDKYVMF